jgi:hypothetical protein
MSDDPDFKNPSLMGNWTGGMDWWQCPRCHSEDVYKAKRPIGSIGLLNEIGDSDRFVGAQRPMVVDVWLCRLCGEIATKFTRARTPKEKEEQKIFNEDFKPSDIPIQVILAFLTMATCAVVVVAMLLNL